MVVTGYATYMKHTQASTKLAYMATMHLGGIRNKYLILAAFYLTGMALKLVLTSQASLAVLMLATVFPVLMALGIRPITGASVLALLCLDYGPNDGSSLFMSTVAKLNPVEMFLHYQARVALCIILVTAVLIPVYYHYMDQKDAEEGHSPVKAPEPVSNPAVPGFYVLLPLIPLIIVFADYFIPSTKIDVITANFIGFAITFLIEFIRSLPTEHFRQWLDGWRSDKELVKAYTIATWLWLGVFALRLVVQVPLYVTNHVGWLGTARLLMGLPFWALAIWVTYLIVATPMHRHKMRERAQLEESAEHPHASNSTQ